MMRLIISVLLFAGYMVYCIVRLRSLPESVSRTVQALHVSWTWLLVMWPIAAMTGTLMLDVTPNDNLKIVPAAFMASMMVLGAAPWVSNGQNAVHNVAGTLTVLLSQAWVAITDVTVLTWWTVAVALVVVDYRRWCLWCELVAALATFDTLHRVLLYISFIV